MANIIPRWEWRTFAENLSEFQKMFTEFELKRQVESDELYIISQKSSINCKIRNELLDIKIPLRIDPKTALEQWTVFDKYAFPLSAEKISILLHLLQVQLVWLNKNEFSQQFFLEEIVDAHQDLKIVPVSKKRFVYQADSLQIEYSQVLFDQDKFDTVAIEGTDVQAICQLRTRLQLDKMKNINYIKAMQGL